jgi:hypothetical protein
MNGIHTSSVPGSRRLILTLVTLMACPILVAFASRFVYSMSYRDSDFFTFWLAAHMNWTGGNPYSAEQWVGEHHHFSAVWISNAVFPYPLPLATLLAPLGLLRLDQAFIVWMALTVVLVAVAAFMLLYHSPDPRIKHYAVPVAAGLLLFRPVWVTLHDGQLGGLLLFLLALTACLWEEGRWAAGGLVIAMIALKPTLGLPILGLVTLWLLANHRWRAILSMAASAAIMLLIGLVRDARWIIEFVSFGRSKLESTFGYAPSLWGMAGAVCRHNTNCSVWLGGLLVAGVMVATAAYLLAAHARLGSLAVVSLSVAVALFITPYVWDYDQVLLILPAVFVVTCLMRQDKPYLVGALFLLATDVAAIVLLLLAIQTGEDVWSGLIPAAVGLAVLWATTVTTAGHALRVVRGYR